MIKKIISNNIDFNNHYLILAFICDKCNYNCIYCYNKKPRSFINLDLLKFYNFLCKLKEHLNKTINLELIGGEPTLHSDLYDFCKKCKDNGIIVTIYTNFS